MYPDPREAVALRSAIFTAVLTAASGAAEEDLLVHWAEGCYRGGDDTNAGFDH